MKYVHHYESPLGIMTMSSDGESLSGLWFGDCLENEYEEKMLPVFEETVKWLDIYFGGNIPNFTPTLSVKTTEFRKKVCDIMLTIPYGKTMTYGEIANMLAKQCGMKRMSAQAVGGAVGHNPIALIIPCHRVMGANGKLTGYAAGIDRKEKLLKLEGII